MSLDDVKRALKEIRKAVRNKDYERAHGLEKKPLIDALRAIESGNLYSTDDKAEWTGPNALAEEVLKATNIKFPRW